MRSSQINSEADFIDLKELFEVGWKNLNLIFYITITLILISIIVSLFLKNYYRSESILMSVESTNQNIASQYSGLASLAGISIPGSGNDSVAETLELIKSREFVKHLIKFERVLPSLMAAKSFDDVSQTIIFDSDIYDVKTETWKRKPNGNKGSKPSYLETHKEFINNVLRIEQDKNTGLIYISVEHLSPFFAKELLSLIINEANSLKRKNDINIANNAISYLSEELSKTSLAEIRMSISKLIESQLETQMAARINKEYSLSIIEPPFVPEEKFRPSRSLIVLLTSIFGFMLSLIFVYSRHFFQKNYIENSPQQS